MHQIAQPGAPGDFTRETAYAGHNRSSRKITVDAQGEVLQLKVTINTMVDQLSAFADEVTRVAGEVGTEGRLDGQAEVEEPRSLTAQLQERSDELQRQQAEVRRSNAELVTH